MKEHQFIKLTEKSSQCKICGIVRRLNPPYRRCLGEFVYYDSNFFKNRNIPQPVEYVSCDEYIIKDILE